MISFESLEDCYQFIRKLLSKHDFQCNPYRSIQHGIQFLISKDNASEILRVYSGKKGIKIDYSQIKSSEFSHNIQEILRPELSPPQAAEPIPNIFKKHMTPTPSPDQDPLPIIGVDESGKGDYFGPLVIASVYVDESTSELLTTEGIQDSKTLSDTKIARLARIIQTNCPHNVVRIGNTSYNDLYHQVQNLNHILAWGHGKVIENILKEISCDYALSDQFGNPKLVQTALLSKGIDITLFQRPRAESNIAVAAASIIARHDFVSQIKQISSHYSMEFPKGCSKKTISVAQEFVDSFGKKELPNVAKTHFKITQELTE